MDVKQYYRKLREVESGIADEFVLVTSLETSDGGKPGIASEVSREQAAKLIVEGRVRLSTSQEQTAHSAKQMADRKAFEKAEIARRLQVTIVSSPDDRNLEVVTNTPQPAVKR